jgi:hypothetical protein
MSLSRLTIIPGFASAFLMLAIVTSAMGNDAPPVQTPRACVGAYYFDGWAGASERWRDDPQWTRLNPPTHLTKRMIEEFAGREPIWGWRDDKLEIMERQIDLAADQGIAFFAFCWYWNKDLKKLDQDPKHTGLNLFLKARNNHRLKFCLLVANHQGFFIQGTEEWAKAADAWLPYLKHPQHLTVNREPLVIIFNPGNASKEGLAQIQATALKAGLPGVAIAACGSGKAEIGFTHTTHYNIVPGYAAKSEPRPYAELVEAHQRAWNGSTEQPHIPTLTVNWDKRPWEGPRGLGTVAGAYYSDRTPQQFDSALESAITWMDDHPRQTTAERIVLLYAWNELGEGGFLAPTKGDPEGTYLKVVKQVLERAPRKHARAKRILFLGNSITIHGPAAKIGWTNNWGMAASAREKDYVHVLAGSLARLWGSPPEVRVEGMADFERNHDTYDLDAKLKGPLDFQPDIVVVALGENVPALASEEAKTRFQDRFTKLLTALKNNGQPVIVVRSCFWANKPKDEIMQKSCQVVGGVFVDIGGLGKDESNFARSERKFAHAGVANHPGDKGMQAIADALLKAITNSTSRK